MDREKVIKGLECCIQSDIGVFCSEDCPYYDVDDEDNSCETQMKQDALALLKEQENASKRNPVIVCPHCGKRVK
jgi:hypothetical protein